MAMEVTYNQADVVIATDDNHKLHVYSSLVASLCFLRVMNTNTVSWQDLALRYITSVIHLRADDQTRKESLHRTSIFGASLSEPHTSVTALRTRVCIYIRLFVCLDRPLTVNFK